MKSNEIFTHENHRCFKDTNPRKLPAIHVTCLVELWLYCACCQPGWTWWAQSIVFSLNSCWVGIGRWWLISRTFKPLLFLIGHLLQWDSCIYILVQASYKLKSKLQTPFTKFLVNANAQTVYHQHRNTTIADLLLACSRWMHGSWCLEVASLQTDTIGRKHGLPVHFSVY